MNEKIKTKIEELEYLKNHLDVFLSHTDEPKVYRSDFLRLYDLCQDIIREFQKQSEKK